MREATVRRKTKETDVSVRLNLDGRGEGEISTPIKFFNHLLSAFAKHGCFDLRIEANGDFPHHVAEDCMIALGMAIDQALGKKEYISRMGEAIVPMDDALVLVAVDLGGRVYYDVRGSFKRRKLDDLESDLIFHLLQTLAANGKFTLHVEVLRGTDDHHKAEAIFKALGTALRRAVKKHPRRKTPSTKGVV